MQHVNVYTRFKACNIQLPIPIRTSFCNSLYLETLSKAFSKSNIPTYKVVFVFLAISISNRIVKIWCKVDLPFWNPDCSSFTPIHKFNLLLIILSYKTPNAGNICIPRKCFGRDKFPFFGIAVKRDTANLAG